MSLASTVPRGLDGDEGSGAWRLLLVHAPDAGAIGRSTPLVGPLTLGREPSDDESRLEVPDPGVSRNHAAIEPDPDGSWRVRDLESRNGTFVNGERIGGAPLEDGSVLRLGDHLFVAQYLGAFDLELMLLPPTKRASLIGRGAAMMRVWWGISMYGPSKLPVLVTGETGVGKELVAAELHAASGRDGELVPVNCAALPAHLVESELFGHAQGAFTGASGKSEGLFGRAAGGTLFLDEIGEMPVDLQAKLLRALATGEVRGVGETVARHVDVRVIAATNVDLQRAVAEGTFRADLYSRLMAASIRVAPLRERREDVLPLAAHFLERAGASPSVTADAAEALLTHDWPYNVRELEQCASAAALRSGTEPLGRALLPEAVRQRVDARRPSARPAAAKAPLALRINREQPPNAADLREVLEHFGGSIADAARFFGKDRKQLYRWAERLGVDLESLR
ncbi:MAG: sigma 54-interacting transcriptional regulator [Deltaproteobacteria bacterium]|nr:sigma 54-interacting transcriptional regulator [Deltaproteobacteria bacterium]